MINRAILVGRLTRDPELRRTANDIPVATFTLAVNRPYSNPSGESDADFIQCVVWRRKAETVSQFLSKGSLVGVEGRIQTRTYDDQEGNRKYITEVLCDSVQFLEPRSASDNQSSTQEREEPRSKPKEEKIPDVVSEDDLPF